MYSNYITINKNFQSSINLELDLNNEKKIEEYIPTRDICDVLKRYIAATFSNNGERATTLVGPYGKGKSFLLLVLSYIISQNPKSKAYKQLLLKIKKTDNDLYESIKKFNSSNQRLLPVVINSNYDNLNQAFMLALNEALKRENIKDIIPETTYSVCLQLIKEWKKDPDFSHKTLAKCQNELGVGLERIEMGLKDFSPEAYGKFTTLYNCVTHGMPFNPLVNDDVVHVYSEVNYELKNRGYNGIFIIFDEFSKFLESSNDAIPKNLKIIQDFAEAAARSGSEEQLHICCVTHKSFSLYKTTDKADSFKTVEGRFKEIKFNRSLDENYQIISAAIGNDGYSEKIKKFVDENQSFYDEVKQFEPFARNKDQHDLIYGCFPLNPITVYALIQLSELVAQNERTLFTFICDIDDNSLNTFISRNDKGLFNTDKIYDYFSPLLRREESNDIRNIWYRTEGTLARVEEEDERKIIKTLAVILMINEPDLFPASEKNIALAAMLPEVLVYGKTASLVEKRFLRKNLINNLLSFASTNNKEIEDKISIVSQTKTASMTEESVLNEINDNRYILPRRYNEQNKITRFYKVSFISEQQLNDLSSFKVFKDQEFSDGIVLNLVRKEMTEKQIKEKFLSFKDKEVLLKYPKKPVNKLLNAELLRYISIQELLNKGGNDEVITSELELLLQENIEDIKKILEDSFESDYSYLSYPELSVKDFNELTSDQMEAVFPKKIVFNNELVNKNTVTSVYQKAVNNVLDDLLNKHPSEYSETSPETTIRKSVIEQIDTQADVKEVTEYIKEAIRQAEKEKLQVSSLVEKYTAPPYGIRKGIMAILLAECISELPDNVLLYYRNKEIDINANNLVKAVNADADYYLRSSKGTIAQSDYMNSLFELLNKKPSGNFRIDNRTISEELRKFFVGLPSIIKNAEKGNVLNVPEEIIEYRKCFFSFNINPYEVVFEKPIEIFKSADYGTVREKLGDFVLGWKELLSEYKKTIVDSTKEQLGIDKNASLHMGLESILQKIIGTNKPILEDANTKIYNLILELSYDDTEAINALSNSILSVYIEDWQNDRSKELVDGIQAFIDDLAGSKTIDSSSSSLDKLINVVSSEERSAMGKLFQNSIENVIDEFGDSITSSEKIAILSEMLKKYL